MTNFNHSNYLNHNETVEVRFSITYIYYHNPDCSATLKAQFIKTGDMPIARKEAFVKGFFTTGLTVGDIYNATGYWRQTKGGNSVLVLESSSLYIQSTYLAIGNFLERANGIGKKTAEAIVEKFGRDTFRIITKDSQQLTTVPRVGPKQALSIKTMVEREVHFPDIATFLASRKINYDYIAAIYDIYGAETKSALKNNPYSLSGAVKMTFEEIDRFALTFGIDLNDKRRLFYGTIDSFENEISSSGNVYLERNELEQVAKDYLIRAFYAESWFEKGLSRDDITKLIVQKQGELDVKDIKYALESLMGKSKIVNDEGKFYLKRYYHYERNVINTIEDALTKYKIDTSLYSKYYRDVRDYLTTYENDFNIQFAEEQKNAILMALSNKISILTGGPGTGKTHTLKMIIEALKIKGSLRLTPLLVAPTGKAAKRMSEVIDMKACTIHRAIGMRGSYSSNKDIHLTNNLVIVDETSMVDIQVFSKLLSAIDFETCNLLLVGDSEQLPSVGPGLILRDLIKSKRIPVTRLQKIFRQAESSQIITNAYAIIEERPYDLRFNEKKDFFFMNKENPLEIKALLINTIRRLFELGYSLNDIQILSPMKKGVIGTEELNYEIQRQFNKSKSVATVKKGRSLIDLKVGDKVIQTKNNYDLEVFNGEVGTIISLGLSIDVNYGDRIVQYLDEKDVQDIELAYAITIHKSQGSEYPIVIMPIHESHNILLNKNLLYTGITRAKTKVCVIGQLQTFRDACMVSDQTIRNSQVQKFLEERLPELKTPTSMI